MTTTLETIGTTIRKAVIERHKAPQVSRRNVNSTLATMRRAECRRSETIARFYATAFKATGIRFAA